MPAQTRMARLCPVCAHYFVSSGKAAKHLNCSSSCKQRASGGTDRVQQWRADLRGQFLERARSMQRQGKSKEEIGQVSELPGRVLDRLFEEAAT